MRELASPAKTDSGRHRGGVGDRLDRADRARDPAGVVPLLPDPDGDAGQMLTFKVLQTYSNGDVVHWIDPSLAAGHPAPTVDVTPQGRQILDFAGMEADADAEDRPARQLVRLWSGRGPRRPSAGSPPIGRRPSRLRAR